MGTDNLFINSILSLSESIFSYISVTKRIIKALEAKKPKLRYYVTAPTFFSAAMKRLLSDKTQDLILKYRPNNFR